MALILESMQIGACIGRFLSAVAAASLLTAGAVAAGPVSLVREQKAVAVNGVRESWRLQWDAEPESACGPEDMEVALACPCSGFAYGEAGRLSLVRTRPGKPVERLELAPFFKDADAPGAAGVAVLQRWRPIPAAAHDEEDDWHHAADFDFLKRVHARGSTEVISLFDYNHDGQATEFLLQVGAGGCGKRRMVLVGVSRYNPRLHVFASAEVPDQPLVLLAPVWAIKCRVWCEEREDEVYQISRCAMDLARLSYGSPSAPTSCGQARVSRWTWNTPRRDATVTEDSTALPRSSQLDSTTWVGFEFRSTAGG